MEAASGVVQTARCFVNRALIAACLALALPASGQRVILVTLDGLGHEIVTRDNVASELTILRDAMRDGATAEGMKPPRPALTAVSHASIWTGAGPEVNGVPFNNPPTLPRHAHRATETVVGFQGTRLLAEPFWVAAGRQGVKALAFQPTQGFPFTSVNTGPLATVINSYQTRSYAPYAIFGPGDVEWKTGGGFSFRHGSKSYRAEPADGGLLITQEAGGSVLLPLAAVEQVPPRERDLARHFRAIVQDGGETGRFFRLFGYDASAAKLRLLVSSSHETAYHDGTGRRLAEVQAMVNECGPVVVNGATVLLNSAKISPAEYLETVELVIRQLSRQAAWADERVRPRIVQGYLPYPDEFDHQWIALGRAGGEFERYRRWGYTAVNRGMEAYAALAKPGDWFMWGSDHGMAEIRKSVNIGQSLARAGLEGKAVALYNSVLVNTEDWANGEVSRRKKDEILSKVREALESIRDPETSQPVVRETRTGSDRIPVCDGCADLYFDLQPGYRTGGTRSSDLVVRFDTPEGAHGFAPERADMKAFFAVKGPGIAPGSFIREMRTIDIAPYICALLGIQPPRQSQGRRPVVEVRSSP